MKHRNLLLSLALGTAAVIAIPAQGQYQDRDQDQNGQYQRDDQDRDHVRVYQDNGQQDRDRQYNDRDRQYGDRDRQYGTDQTRDRDRYDRQQYVNSEAYQRGVREGMRDRNHNRQANPQNADQWTNDVDRQAYMAGYDDGFSGRDQNSGYRDHGGYDRDRDHQH